ncbi:MAG TPA: hydrogenase maturation protease [Streptosporangiaceae bacterium]|nr:hydrogenase maturation protease [Streptosporangiaceae bacterium]
MNQDLGAVPAGTAGTAGRRSGPRTIVIGVGNEFRRDDGIGPYVVALLRNMLPRSVRLLVSDGEPGRLIEEWAGADLAVVVDAARPRSGQVEPGRTHRIVVGQTDQLDQWPVTPVSSHGFGLDAAIGLGRALGRMPGRLIVHAAEAADWGYGTGLTPEVSTAASALAAAIVAEVSTAAG